MLLPYLNRRSESKLPYDKAYMYGHNYTMSKKVTLNFVVDIRPAPRRVFDPYQLPISGYHYLIFLLIN